MKTNFKKKLFYAVGVVFFTVTVFSSFININTTSVFKPSFTQGLPDTSSFIPNYAEGWNKYSSYQKISGDSVEFELILRREVNTNIDWTIDTKVGSISDSYRPPVIRVIDYAELPRHWKITIQPDGKCFFKLMSGPVPEGNSIVIPVITKYKK